MNASSTGRWAALVCLLSAGLVTASVAQAQTFSISDVTVTEGQGATFTVTRAGTSQQLNSTATINFATQNGTAEAGSDYTALSGPLNFARRARSQTITVSTFDDQTAESTESFSVTLTNASQGSISDATGVATIQDNDAPPTTSSLTIDDVTATEGGSASFTVTLSPASSQTVTVVASTANGTASAGSDFTARSNVTLSFAPGTTSQSFSVQTLNDTTAEATESFAVNLANATGATIADAQGTGTIADNDFSSAAQAHATMTSYDGPQTCVACHTSQALAMHGSVHYQQNGPTDFVTNIAGNAGEGPAGKPSGVDAVIGINTYCGTHENSPRFTCAGCHVGNGRFPKTPTELADLGNGTAPTPSSVNAAQLQELANIDCLMCHQQAYKRFPDWTSTGYGFRDLVIDNVTLDGNGLLAPAIGQSVTRTGIQGIPNVDSLTLDFQFRPSGAAGSLIPLPDGAPGGGMTLTTEGAAQAAHRTTRQSCLNCHAGAAGANGAKRGDLSTTLWDPPVGVDMHMSPGTGGANLTCSSCHNVNGADGRSAHRVRGRGLDLRANDVATRFTCDNSGCHSSTPHAGVAATDGTTLNRHTRRVACQTCHIPSYGKGTKTEVARDWQAPHVTQTACNGRGGWLPAEYKGGQGALASETPDANNPDYRAPLKPTYQWFDGTSQVYYLTESLSGTPTKDLPSDIALKFGMAAGTPAYVMGRPNGGVNTAGAKIYPMKEHWGKLARATAPVTDTVKNPAGVPVDSLVPSSTFEFFRTGSFCRSVAVAMRDLDPVNDPADETTLDNLCPNQDTLTSTLKQDELGVQVVAVHTYQTINHGVEQQTSALGYGNTCGACHNVVGMTGGPPRMDLKGQLGYQLRTDVNLPQGPNPTTGDWLCVGCHKGGKVRNAVFTKIHSVGQHQSRGCNACHAQVSASR